MRAGLAGLHPKLLFEHLFSVQASDNERPTHLLGGPIHDIQILKPNAGKNVVDNIPEHCVVTSPQDETTDQEHGDEATNRRA
ncbi:MAG: hypothetical protein BRD35_01765 [Bacteroidetes bacterium QH_7_62_13]|nr:MAG: hypothetical protein BRD35_01765 [Bacteroidetes bacterium QH_7_62_13]